MDLNEMIDLINLLGAQAYTKMSIDHYKEPSKLINLVFSETQGQLARLETGDHDKGGSASSAGKLGVFM
jgi:hypothetical protein